MAFFGLSDINFNQDAQRNFGPLSALENTPYSYSTLKYPLDVGSHDKGHYVVFFVREQAGTQFSAEIRGGDVLSDAVEQNIRQSLSKGVSVADRLSTSKIKTSFAAQVNKGLEDLISKGTSSLRQNFGATGGNIANSIDSFVSGPKFSSAQQKTDARIENSIKEITKKAGPFNTNTTKLTTDAIAMYMPDTIAFDSTQSYTDLSPGEELTGQSIMAGKAMAEGYEKGGLSGAFDALKKSGAAQAGLGRVLENLNVKGLTIGKQNIRAGMFAATGKVINPLMELLYISPQFRDFQFEFFFYPRSEDEALEVQKIIDRFRFHQSPEIDKIGADPSGLLIPPSEFEIKFFYAGKQNPNIPPISTCVLKGISVNFAPNGWTAYEVPGENDPGLGRTGMPVAIQMTLQFTETTYLTKDDFGDQKIRKNTPASSMTGVTQTSSFPG